MGCKILLFVEILLRLSTHALHGCQLERIFQQELSPFFFFRFKTVLNKMCEIHVMRLCTTPKQIKTTAHNFSSTILLKTEE
jgi:hypothetical protein